MSEKMAQPLDLDKERQVLDALIEMNGNLEESVNSSTNRAFNLGCAVGFLPASIMILVTYFLTGKSWLGTTVMVVLMLLGLVLFANLVASITRRNTIKRLPVQDIQSKIDALAEEFHLDVLTIEKIGIENLQKETALWELLINLSPTGE